ncbi:MAG: hypothetical protein AUI14_08715 [Actinobacteria bacterium 13_2_20CM_2_71_6]|nr:MAG: hypothetical protein AUI14_08715 [Actinobacteria bacterium 13_2_20CM_2_71_6]
MVGVLALIAIQASPAHAHPQAQGTDVVGVGSDTAQYGVDFLVEGVNGKAGFNSGSLDRRAYAFDASGDGSGGATTGATVILRAGSTKVTPLPNGSGAGITAMLGDLGASEQINFVRSSRLPKSTEQATANDPTHQWGGLHVFQFATDGLQIAVSQLVATNVPATLTSQDLICIYQGQNTGPGAVCPQFASIVPFLPQSGSGTRTFFLDDLAAANGGTALSLGTNVQSMQEHDPTPIKSNANAIAPFSTGRVSLLNSGYLGDGTGGTPALKNVVKLLTAAGNFSDPARGLYILVRERDVHDHTNLPATGVTASGQAFPWQADGTRNWVETLFAGPTSWVAKTANNPLIAGAFFTPAYSDLGIVSSG